LTYDLRNPILPFEKFKDRQDITMYEHICQYSRMYLRKTYFYSRAPFLKLVL